MPDRMWTRESVIAAIRGEAAAGHELSYSKVGKRVPSLLRAAERVFGHWSTAVEAAGFDYASIRRYRKWTRQAVIDRILELYHKGEDLSWRNVSEVIDPPLAAAALQANRFPSWNDALSAAGLDPDQIMRYRRWTPDTMRAELAALAREGINLDQDSLRMASPSLLAAVYRVGAGLATEREDVVQVGLSKPLE